MVVKKKKAKVMVRPKKKVVKKAKAKKSIIKKKVASKPLRLVKKVHTAGGKKKKAKGKK